MTTNTGTAIVQAAYEDAGMCAVGQNINVGQEARGLSRLNDIIALYATQGLKVWLNRTVVVPLVSGQEAYVLGPGGDVDMTRPLQVLQGYYLWASSASQQPLTLIAREQWLRVRQTTVTGAINSFYPDKQAFSVTVYFWNIPDAQAAAGTVTLSCRVAVDPMVTLGASTVYPQEWALALRWALADEVATGQPKELQDRCALRAAAYREALEAFDVEDAPTMFLGDGRAYGGGQGFR